MQKKKEIYIKIIIIDIISVFSCCCYSTYSSLSWDWISFHLTHSLWLVEQEKKLHISLGDASTNKKKIHSHSHERERDLDRPSWSWDDDEKYSTELGCLRRSFLTNFSVVINNEKIFWFRFHSFPLLLSPFHAYRCSWTWPAQQKILPPVKRSFMPSMSATTYYIKNSLHFFNSKTTHCVLFLSLSLLLT